MDNLNNFINIIKNMRDKDYENFVKAIINVEKGIEDKSILDEIYNKYLNNDYCVDIFSINDIDI